MTDTDNTKPANSKAPSHTVYHVREVNHDESYWTRIGAAWAHRIQPRGSGRLGRGSVRSGRLPGISAGRRNQVSGA